MTTLWRYIPGDEETVKVPFSVLSSKGSMWGLDVRDKMEKILFEEGLEGAEHSLTFAGVVAEPHEPGTFVIRCTLTVHVRREEFWNTSPTEDLQMAEEDRKAGRP
jgi:hypothetical protein